MSDSGRESLEAAYRLRVNALLRLIDAIDFEITAVAGPLRADLGDHAGFRAVQNVPGVGPTLAAVFVAEIGDVTRFASPAHLSSWAGLTPKHRESDTVVRRGPITKQGSTLERWAAVEAAHGARNADWLSQTHTRIAERRGRNIATVAVARKLLTYVYYGLRDGRIRALEQTPTAA
jgi:transposase